MSQFLTGGTGFGAVDGVTTQQYSGANNPLLACGDDAIAYATNSTCCGQLSRAGNSFSNNGNSTAFGFEALATGDFCVSVGSASQAGVTTNPPSSTGTNSVSIGYSALSRNTNGVTIGSLANSGDNNVNATAVGFNSSVTNANSTVVGANSTSSGSNSVVLGYNSTDNGNDNIVSVGSAVQSRRIMYVTDGIDSNDAVNVEQLLIVSNTADTALVDAISAQEAANTALINSINALASVTVASTTATTAQNIANTALTNSINSQTVANMSFKISMENSRRLAVIEKFLSTKKFIDC